MVTFKEESLITEATLNPFIQQVKAALFDGLSLAEVEGFTPRFIRPDLEDVQVHLEQLGPEERVWIEQRLEPPHIYDQIQAAAAVAAAKRRRYPKPRMQNNYDWCSAAAALRHSYTDVAAAADEPPSPHQAVGAPRVPSSLTDASRRWVVIADRHPGLDDSDLQARRLRREGEGKRPQARPARPRSHS